METFEKVKTAILSTLDCDESAIRPEASLTEDLGIDSLDAVELGMALEQEAGQEIPDDAMEGMRTVQDLVDYIAAHQG